MTDKFYVLAFAYERKPYVSLRTRISWDQTSEVIGYSRVNKILDASLFKTKKEAEKALNDLRKTGEKLGKMNIAMIVTSDRNWY